MIYYGDEHANTFHGAKKEENTAYGFAGDDKLYGGDVSDVLTGGLGSDLLSGGDGDDVLYGYNDMVEPLATDRLRGGAGDDLIYAGWGDTIDGGSGTDRLALDLSNASVGVTIDFSQTGSLANGGGTISNIEALLGLIGSSHDDVLTLGAGDPRFGSPVVDGGAGDDRITGNLRDDQLFGGGGSDVIHGGSGNDILRGAEGATPDTDGADSLFGDAGDDDLGLGVNDSADGGTGRDTVTLNLSDAATGVSIDLSGIGHGGTIANGTGTIANLEVLGFVRGSEFDDTIVIGDAVQVSYNGVDAGAGNDKVTGGADADQIDGSDGDDQIWGMGGNDDLSGDDGKDRLHGGDASDVLQGGTGKDQLWGDDGNDLLFGGEGDDVLKGGAGNDQIEDTEGANTLRGGSGDDMLNGGAGSHLLGDSGNDSLAVRAGATIDGGSGLDTISYHADYTIDPLVLDFSVLAGSGSGTVGGASITNVEAYSVINGSSGNDTITVGDLAEKADGAFNALGVFGDYGDDRLIGGSAGNTLIGGDGDDRLDGKGGDDYLDGGSGIDKLYGGSGNDVVYAYGGGDRLDGGSGNDNITADPGFASTASTILGGSGNDTLQANWGDTIDGGSGQDTLSITTSSSERVVFDYSSGAASVAGGTITGIETIAALNLTDQNDVVDLGTLVMSSSVNGINGQLGDDRLAGGAGADTFLGGDGNDRLTGRDGNDKLDGGVGDDRLSGGAGDDVLSLGVGKDIADGGDGNDTVVLDGNGVSVDLSKTGAQVLGDSSITLTSIENVIGSGGDDHLTGTTGANVFGASWGHDVITGGGGNDTLSFELIYYFYGGVAVDLAAGEATAYYGVDTDFTGIRNVVGGGDYDVLSGDGHANRLDGGGGNDQLAGRGGADVLVGGDGDDRLDGGVGSDAMTGGAGDDSYVVDSTVDTVSEGANGGYDRVQSSVSYTLTDNVEALTLSAAGTGTGNDGDNDLVGSSGNDVLRGAGGNDRIDGGSGTDKLTGGTGADAFMFGHLSVTDQDRVTDFAKADGDYLDLQGLKTAAAAFGVTALHDLGTGAFTGEAGDVRTELHSGYALFMLDIDGDKAAELTVRLDGVTSADQVQYLF